MFLDSCAYSNDIGHYMGTTCTKCANSTTLGHWTGKKRAWGSVVVVL